VSDGPWRRHGCLNLVVVDQSVARLVKPAGPVTIDAIVNSTTSGTGWAPASPVSVMDFRPAISELRLRKNAPKTFRKPSSGVLVKDGLNLIPYRLTPTCFLSENQPIEHDFYIRRYMKSI
jgi:hypothetical protein